jgi:CRISPR/Cas system CSM-associated protein Csm2 small subunit
MPDFEKRKRKVQTVIQEMMDSVMDKVLIDDPFSPEELRKIKPLYASLVPEEIFKGSHFER